MTVHALRWWHTLRHLRPVQFYGRAWFRLHRPRVDTRPAPASRTGLARPPFVPVAASSLLGPTRLRFLAEEHELDDHGWDDRRRADNRHYDHRYHDHGYGGRYKVVRYYPPKNYRHHRWYRGAYLPAAYYAPRYVVHNYSTYRLRPPPRGYHWVRVDNDVILAAIATGLVANVVSDIFY